MLQRGSWKKWAVVTLAALTTGCAAVAGVGVGVVFVGAGALAFTCYDRVSVVVTDRLTGTQLCDAKVTFIEGKSQTEATSCYQAALSAGKYRLRVERRGLVPYEVPIEVADNGGCGQTVQTMYVALDRPGTAPPGGVLRPPAALPAAPSAPVAPAAPAAAPSASAPPAPATSASPATAPAPSLAPASSVPAPSVPAPSVPAPGIAPAPSVAPTPSSSPPPQAAPAPSAAPPAAAFPDSP